MWREHIEAIKNRGLKITGEGGERFVKLGATVDPQEVGIVDVVLVQTKARRDYSGMEPLRSIL